MRTTASGDDGAYAELLFVAAMGGVRNADSTAKGNDVIHPDFGRIEVRSRRLPFDGRQETRAALPEWKIGHFDWMAHILFATDYSVRGGYLAPADDFVALARRTSRKVAFANGARLPTAIDITAQQRVGMTAQWSKNGATVRRARDGGQQCLPQSCQRFWSASF
jgi:hypothetical protein